MTNHKRVHVSLEILLDENLMLRTLLKEVREVCTFGDGDDPLWDKVPTVKVPHDLFGRICAALIEPD